jgi:hypothetical protein
LDRVVDCLTAALIRNWLLCILRACCSKLPAKSALLFSTLHGSSENICASLSTCLTRVLCLETEHIGPGGGLFDCGFDTKLAAVHFEGLLLPNTDDICSAAQSSPAFSQRDMVCSTTARTCASPNCQPSPPYTKLAAVHFEGLLLPNTDDFGTEGITSCQLESLCITNNPPPGPICSAAQSSPAFSQRDMVCSTTARTCACPILMTLVLKGSQAVS